VGCSFFFFSRFHFVFASQNRIIFIAATLIYPRLVKLFLSPIFVGVEFRILCGVLWIGHVNGRFSSWIGCPFSQLTQIVFLEEYKRSYLFYADGGMQMGYWFVVCLLMGVLIQYANGVCIFFAELYDMMSITHLWQGIQKIPGLSYLESTSISFEV